MQQRFIQIIGIIWILVYGSLIAWIYTTEPRSFKEVATNTQVAAGTYEINEEKFGSGLTLFRRDQFRAAAGRGVLEVSWNWVHGGLPFVVECSEEVIE